MSSRRTRAHPSPGGFKSLEDVEAPRAKKPTKSATATTIKKRVPSGTRTQRQTASEVDVVETTNRASVPKAPSNDTKSTSRKRKASKSQITVESSEADENAITSSQRIGTRATTRSTSPPATSQSTRKPGRPARTNVKRTRAQQSTEELTAHSAEEETEENRPAKRSRNGDTYNSPRGPVTFAENDVEQGESTSEFEAPQSEVEEQPQQKNTPKRRESIMSQGISTPTPATKLSPKISKSFDNLPQTEKRNTTRLIKTPGSSTKTPQKKQTKFAPRTEPAQQYKSHKPIKSIPPQGTNMKLYDRWLLDEWCYQFGSDIKTFRALDADKQKAIIKVQRRLLFDPQRTYEQYLKDTDNGKKRCPLPTPPETEENEDEDEYSMILYQKSPVVATNTSRIFKALTSGGDKELTKLPGSGPSTTNSIQSTSNLIPSAVVVMDKEALLTDPDVLEAARIISEVYAADQSRRSKPFPDAELLGSFLDDYQQGNPATSRAITAPEKSTTQLLEYKPADDSDDGSNNSDQEDEGNGDSEDLSHDAGEVYQKSTAPQTPSPEPEEHRPQESGGFLFTLKSTLASPLKFFGRSNMKPPATHSGLIMNKSTDLSAAKPQGFATPTPQHRTATSKFGTNPTAGIKAAVDKRNARKQSKVDEVPIHLRGLKTPALKAELKRIEEQENEDRHAEQRRKHREAVQAEETAKSEWDEEYVCEKGITWIATWVYEDGKRRKIIGRRLKNPGWSVPDESSSEESEDDDDVPVNSSSSAVTPAEFARLEAEETARVTALQAELGDPHHARPYTGSLFGPPGAVERNIQAGRHALYNGPELSRSTGNIFTNQNSTVGARSSGFRPPSASSSSSGGDPSDQLSDNDFATMMNNYQAERLGKEEAESRATTEGETSHGADATSDETSALQQKKWTQVPPPKPKPSNATLPGKPAVEEETVQTNKVPVPAPAPGHKYLPKKPSRLREVEQASPVPQKEKQIFDISVLIRDSLVDLNVDPEVLSMVYALGDDQIIDTQFYQNRGENNSVERAVEMLF